MNHDYIFTFTAFIRKYIRLIAPERPFAIGAICKWGVLTRRVSFEKCPHIFSKFFGNMFFIKLLSKIAILSNVFACNSIHGLLRSGTACKKKQRYDSDKQISHFSFMPLR
ncbi:MAG: hypothetical protein ACE5GV_01675 [Candidatus Scalindua sp.]